MNNLLTPAALEAAAKAIYNLHRLRQHVEDVPWETLPHEQKQPYISEAQAAFNAAIAKLIAEGDAEVCQDFVWGDDGEDHKFGLGEGENGEDDMPTVIVIKGEP